MFGSAQLQQSSKADVVAMLRRTLAAQAPANEQLNPIQTGISVLDAELSGGLPRGKIAEIIGGAGKMAFALLALAAATQRGELCAFVDCEDALDVQTAARVGVVLERLLWVRPETEANSATPDQSGLKAVDLLLGAGGFGLVVFWLSPRAQSERSWRSAAAFSRLLQRCEKAKAALLIVTEQPVAGSFAAATLRCAAGQTVWGHAPGGRLVLRAHHAAIEVVRTRFGAPGEVETLPLSK